MNKTLPFLILSAVILLGASFIGTGFNSTGSSINHKLLTAQVGGATPTVDIKANGSDGPITVPYYSDVTLSWNSTDKSFCSSGAIGDYWSSSGFYINNASKDTSLNGEKTVKAISKMDYFISCSGNGTDVDVVTVDVLPDPNPIKVNLMINGVDGTKAYSGTGGRLVVPWNADMGRFEDIRLTWTSNYPDLKCTVKDGGFHDISRLGFPGTASGEFALTSLDLLKLKDGALDDYSSQSSSINGGWSIQCTGRGQTTSDTEFVQAGLPPTIVYKVNLLANGASREITVPRGTDVLLSWTSNYISDASCQASGSWSGYKANSGQEFTGALTSNGVYTIKCNRYSPLLTSEDTVTIYVSDNAIKPPTATTPVIMTNPQNQSITTAQTATFSCSASGSGVSYQWQYRNPGVSAFSDISGGTGSTYIFKNPGVNYSGTQYRCVATNSAGSASSNAATLTVTESKSTPVAGSCDTTAKAVVTALGGCSNVDKTEYKNVYAACCTLITKTTLLQILNDALADGVIDATEKKALLGALNSYLSK